MYKNRAFVVTIAFLFVLLTACQSASREALRPEVAQSLQPAKRNLGKLIHVAQQTLRENHPRCNVMVQVSRPETLID